MTRTPRFAHFLTPEDVAARFGITVDTITGWRAAGLPYYRLGKRVWLYEPHVAAWILDHLAINPQEVHTK